MIVDIRFTKLDPLAQIPVKPYDGNAGWDLTYIGPDILIHANESKLLKTGLGFHFSNEWCIDIVNRGGVAFKKQLIIGSELVDSNYSGEVFVNLQNISNTTKEIKTGDKIAQFLVLPVPQINFIQLSNEEFEMWHAESARQQKCLGSSG